MYRRTAKDIERKILAIYKKYGGNRDSVLKAVAREFSWTIAQAYVATEFLYRQDKTK